MKCVFFMQRTTHPHKLVHLGQVLGWLKQTQPPEMHLPVSISHYDKKGSMLWSWAQNNPWPGSILTCSWGNSFTKQRCFFAFEYSGLSDLAPLLFNFLTQSIIFPFCNGHTSDHRCAHTAATSSNISQKPISGKIENTITDTEWLDGKISCSLLLFNTYTIALNRWADYRHFRGRE